LYNIVKEEYLEIYGVNNKFQRFKTRGTLSSFREFLGIGTVNLAGKTIWTIFDFFGWSHIGLI
jgi:hypothetical protein